ncbi:hypothetical protein AAVH_41451 [Aphelenchoides avenae]|nr:hypothetical protein AAVH_41451 [Aphelenchus avenae]
MSWFNAEASSPFNPKNRTACVAFYKDELTRICTADGEQWPCFNGSKLDNEGKIDHLFKLDFLASSCCSAASSEQEILEHFCCRSEECLYKCYRQSTPQLEDRRTQRLRQLAAERLRMWEKFYPDAEPPALFFDTNI